MAKETLAALQLYEARNNYYTSSIATLVEENHKPQVVFFFSTVVRFFKIWLVGGHFFRVNNNVSIQTLNRPRARYLASCRHACAVYVCSCVYVRISRMRMNEMLLWRRWKGFFSRCQICKWAWIEENAIILFYKLATLGMETCLEKDGTGEGRGEWQVGGSLL